LYGERELHGILDMGRFHDPPVRGFGGIVAFDGFGADPFSVPALDNAAGQNVVLCPARYKFSTPLFRTKMEIVKKYLPKARNFTRT
jgi:hypothetical protein